MSSEEPDLPVAAKVTAVGGMPNEGAAIQNFVQISEGDELVKKSDAQEAIKKARRQERQKILDKLDDIEQRFHDGDKKTAGTLKPSKLVTEVLETIEEELRDELEEEVETA